MEKDFKPEKHGFNFALIDHALRYVVNNSEFYKALYRNVDTSSIKTLKTFQELPFVSKSDLTSNSKKFWCVGPNSIRDYCSTSGSEGHPMTTPLTENDLKRLTENEAGSFAIAGLSNTEIIQLCTTTDKRFMAGLAYILGARKLGSGIIRTGSGLPEYQWRTIIELRPTTLIVVPSFLVNMLAFAKENGIDPSKTSVKRAICIGESIRNPNFTLNALGVRITENWGVDLHSTYASSEMQTAFTECSESHGGHYNPSLIYPEVIDEEGNVLPPGQSGELVVTTLGVEGFPLVRYKTGDITCLHADTCACGNKSMRVGPVEGRKNQMIKVKGTSCYPPALKEVLNGIESIEYFQIQVFYDELGNDAVRIYLSSGGNLQEKFIADIFRSRVRFAPEIIRVESSELVKMVYPDNTRKAILFKDLRQSF